MKPIQTEYNGYRFRSRLEARWAVFLDALNIDWVYEREGFELSNGELYLPDFWIPCPRYYDEKSGYWLEIKGSIPSREERNKCRYLSKDTGHITRLVYGSVTEEKFHTYTYMPVRKNSVIVDVTENHSQSRSAAAESLFKLTGFDPDSEPFWAHFEIATCFWSGQKDEKFSNENYINAIKAARGARFEHGEKGV